MFRGKIARFAPLRLTPTKLADCQRATLEAKFPPMKRISFLVLLIAVSVHAQNGTALPDKLQALQKSYDAAVTKATAPLTKTYLQELQKLKAEYTKAGDLKSAVATEDLISSLSLVPGAPNAANVPLGDMTLVQFKNWLTGVKIMETTGFMNTFTFDGTTFSSEKKETGLRKHPDVIIEVGRIFVPFTSTNATILIDRNLNKATVNYSTGGKIEADIRKNNEG